MSQKFFAPLNYAVMKNSTLIGWSKIQSECVDMYGPVLSFQQLSPVQMSARSEFWQTGEEEKEKMQFWLQWLDVWNIGPHFEEKIQSQEE